MSDFNEAIILEYVKLIYQERDCKKQVENLPAGYLQSKTIKGKSYCYLQYRVGQKIKSEYIKKDKIEEISFKINQRRDLEKELKLIRNQKKSIESIIDKDILNVQFIKQGVCNVAKEYREITRIFLFGSRAGANYREDSDVDLIFETSEAMSYMKQNEIRMKLEETLGMKVDLIHGPIKDNDFLTVNKEILLYAA